MNLPSTLTTYEYEAMDATGHPVYGIVDASDEKEAIVLIRSMDLWTTTLKPRGKEQGSSTSARHWLPGWLSRMLPKRRHANTDDHKYSRQLSFVP